MPVSQIFSSCSLAREVRHLSLAWVILWSYVKLSFSFTSKHEAVWGSLKLRLLQVTWGCFLCALSILSYGYKALKVKCVCEGGGVDFPINARWAEIQWASHADTLRASSHILYSQERNAWWSLQNTAREAKISTQIWEKDLSVCTITNQWQLAFLGAVLCWFCCFA